MHRATAGFDRAADVYERARPGYPDAAVDWLAALLDLGPSKVVLDLAAGTGKFTRALARTRVELIAVEPSPAMLGLLRNALPGSPMTANCSSTRAHDGALHSVRPRALGGVFLSRHLRSNGPGRRANRCDARL